MKSQSIQLRLAVLSFCAVLSCASVAFAETPRDRISVRRQLEARRRENLARFDAYVARRTFPVNTYRPGRLNVFVDDAGRICAVATIMTLDGQGALVTATSQAQNFVRLADVHDGPIMDWMLGSGFTQEELALIQEPFEMPTTADSGDVETERLMARYRTIRATLVRRQSRSLDVAAARLIAHRAALQSASAPPLAAS